MHSLQVLHLEWLDYSDFILPPLTRQQAWLYKTHQAFYLIGFLLKKGLNQNKFLFSYSNDHFQRFFFWKKKSVYPIASLMKSLEWQLRICMQVFFLSSIFSTEICILHLYEWNRQKEIFVFLNVKTISILENRTRLYFPNLPSLTCSNSINFKSSVKPVRKKKGSQRERRGEK